MTLISVIRGADPDFCVLDASGEVPVMQHTVPLYSLDNENCLALDVGCRVGAGVCGTVFGAI